MNGARLCPALRDQPQRVLWANGACGQAGSDLNNSLKLTLMGTIEALKSALHRPFAFEK